MSAAAYEPSKSGRCGICNRQSSAGKMVGLEVDVRGLKERREAGTQERTDVCPVTDTEENLKRRSKTDADVVPAKLCFQGMRSRQGHVLSEGARMREILRMGKAAG